MYAYAFGLLGFGASLTSVSLSKKSFLTDRTAPTNPVGAAFFERFAYFYEQISIENPWAFLYTIDVKRYHGAMVE